MNKDFKKLFPKNVNEGIYDNLNYIPQKDINNFKIRNQLWKEGIYTCNEDVIGDVIPQRSKNSSEFFEGYKSGFSLGFEIGFGKK
jgi:hypothetical protein